MISSATISHPKRRRAGRGEVAESEGSVVRGGGVGVCVGEFFWSSIVWWLACFGDVVRGAEGGRAPVDARRRRTRSMLIFPRETRRSPPAKL